MHTVTILASLQFVTFAALAFGILQLRKAIRQRRIAQQELQKQLSLRRELINLVSFPVGIQDMDGAYVEMNAAAASLLGLPRELAIGRTITQCIALAEAQGTLLEPVRRMFHSQNLRDHSRVDYVDADGRQKHGLLLNRQVRDYNGKPAAWIGAIVDMTEIVEAERKAQETEARLDDVTRDLPAAVFQMRRKENGELVFPFVGGDSTLLPYFPSNTRPDTSDPGRSSIVSTDAPRLLEMIDASAHTLATLAGEFEVNGDSGRRWLHVNAAPRREADGTVLWNGYWTDVSSERQRMADIEAARDAAQQASVAKDHFLAMMSHEIRTPMSGILGLVELLAQSDLQGEQIAMVSMIHDSAGALLQILDDILDYSKIEAEKLSIDNEPFDMRETCDLVMGLLSARAREKGLRLRCRVASNVAAVVRGDSGRLRQVLFNLLGNAIKFTSTGSVSLAIDVDKETDRRQVLCIQVRDTGIGIEPGSIQLLFSPFVQADSTTSRRYGGTGLGLAISSRLMKLMGGTLELSSTPGVGTCATASMPLSIVSQRPEDYNQFNLVATIRVHDPEVGSAIAEGLLALGVPVTHANDGGASNAADTPSVVFLDDGEPIPEDYPKATAIHVTERAKAAGYRRTQDDIRISVNPLSMRGLRAVCRLAAGHVTVAESGDELCPQFSPPERTRDDAVRDDALVLVAEDNPISRHLIVKQLERLGCACDAFENGEMAFSAWLSHSYALLITDCHMPILNGYALAQRIREREHLDYGPNSRARLPIISLTASMEASERDRCMTSGMDDCMVKPAQLDTLRACLQRWAPRCLTSSAGVTFAQAHSSAIHVPADSCRPEQDDSALPPLDWKAICGNQSTAGRDEELIGIIGKSLRDDAETLRALMLAPDVGELRHWIHRVSGTAMFLHFPPLTEAVDTFRDEILADDPALLKKDSVALEKARNTVLAKLQRISAHLAAQ